MITGESSGVVLQQSGLAARRFVRLDASPYARRDAALEPLSSGVLIQRNRFSLTHAMDTLIPSFRPPIRINFTDRRNNPRDKMRTHTVWRHTVKDTGIGERDGSGRWKEVVRWR